MKNEDTLLELRRMWMFLTWTGSFAMFLCVLLMRIKLSFKFHKNLSCFEVSRTLLNNDDTLLEFKRTWRFLTGADHDLDIFLWWQSVLWIRIWSHGFRAFWLDMDPFLDPDPQIQVIWCFYWIPDKIWGGLVIWILKIRQGVWKLWLFKWS